MLYIIVCFNIVPPLKVHCNSHLCACLLSALPVARAIHGRYSEEGFLQLFVEQKWGYVCVSDYLLGADLV